MKINFEVELDLNDIGEEFGCEEYSSYTENKDFNNTLNEYISKYVAKKLREKVDKEIDIAFMEVLYPVRTNNERNLYTTLDEEMTKFINDEEYKTSIIESITNNLTNRFEKAYKDEIFKKIKEALK